LNKDEVVAMSTVTPKSHLLIVSQGGYGKSTPLASYPRHSRGGQGVRTFRTTDKAGKVAAARVVSEDPGQLILIISAKAQVVRITLEDVRVTGRNTQGVIVWRDREPDDYVASIACFQESDTQEIEDDASTEEKPSKAKKTTSKAKNEASDETEDVEETAESEDDGEIEEVDADDESEETGVDDDAEESEESDTE
jgi:DNA gyrase subunit A